MKFEIEYAGFAEGAAVDLRGNLLVSGFSPSFLALDSFPAQLAPFFMVVAESESPDAEFLPDDVASFVVSVSAPDGQTIYYNEQVQSVQKPPGKKLPARLVMVSQVPIPVSKAGKYQFSLKVALRRTSETIVDVKKDLRIIDSAEHVG